MDVGLGFEEDEGLATVSLPGGGGGCGGPVVEVADTHASFCSFQSHAGVGDGGGSVKVDAQRVLGSEKKN